MNYICTYPSPIGELTITSNGEGITRIDLGFCENTEEDFFTKTAYAQLCEYFEKKRQAFDVPLCPQGTDFQLSVWNSLLKIPYGETRSYKDIAINIRNEKAYRAVGTANGKNPIPIIIPCHRVVAHDKTIGGYSYGTDIKKFLLNLEGVSYR